MIERGWQASRSGGHQTQEQMADEPSPFPVTTAEAPMETAFLDWRERLTRNFARHTEGRWEPLTRVHGR